MSEPELMCAKINELLTDLPLLKDPKQVPFDNGLYLFYEKGEVSKHAPLGRIVRIGNHPHSQNGLKKRLRMHYSGNKNGSVFRKSIGGAFMRKANPNNPCLLPAPGKGHWEKQDMHTCEKCQPVENQVSELLRSNFAFRCIEIQNRELRNRFEEMLVATISFCPTCKPSTNWLGKFAYNQNVKKSGLWNSDYVFNQNAILRTQHLETFSNIVKATKKIFNDL